MLEQQCNVQHRCVFFLPPALPYTIGYSPRYKPLESSLLQQGLWTQAHPHTHIHKHTHTHLYLLLTAKTGSRGSPRERGERLKRNLGKMTQLAIEPPNGRHPLKSPKLWVDLKMIPLMGSPHLSKWVRTRCRKRIDGIRVSVLGSNCSYPCPQ